MTVSGAVDSLIGDVISGWVSSSRKDIVRVVVAFQGEVIQSTATLPRTDGGPNSERFGFRIQLPRAASPGDLFNGQLIVYAATDNKMHPLRVWEPLRLAATLEVLDIGNLEAASRFLSPTKRQDFTKALSDAKSWKQLSKKNKLCVVAYAHDASAWFPYFYRYYSNIAGAAAIYIVTPSPREFDNYRLGGVISIEGLPYDNAARAQMMSRLCQGLQAYYEWSLLCDVDEIVVPHPCSNKTFHEALNEANGLITVSRGFDIIQHDGEADFDFDLPVLAQRRWGIAASGLCKPHLARIPVRWSIGYHFTNLKPQFERPGHGFVTLHLKWACNKIRGEVAQIVQKTKYNVSNTANYALESVSIKRHPGMPIATAPIASLVSDEMSVFERRFLQQVRYNSDEDLWAAEHFVSNNLFDLSATTFEQFSGADSV